MPGAILVAVPAFAREDVHQQDIRIGPQPGEVLYGDAAHALRWGRDRSPVMGDAIALGIKQGLFCLGHQCGSEAATAGGRLIQHIVHAIRP